MNTSSPARDPKSLETGAIRNRGKRKSPWEKGQIGRERPHFSADEPPKSFLGSLPPCGTANRAGLFSPGSGSSDESHSSGEETECGSSRKPRASRHGKRRPESR